MCAQPWKSFVLERLKVRFRWGKCQISTDIITVQDVFFINEGRFEVHTSNCLTNEYKTSRCLRRLWPSWPVKLSRPIEKVLPQPPSITAAEPLITRAQVNKNAAPHKFTPVVFVFWPLWLQGTESCPDSKFSRWNSSVAQHGPVLQPASWSYVAIYESKKANMFVYVCEMIPNDQHDLLNFGRENARNIAM